VPRDGRRGAARGGAGVSGYRSAVQVLALVTIALGVVMLVITLGRGGGVGILLGLLFIAAGAGRLYLLRRR
jgi:hypothetical protein